MTASPLLFQGTLLNRQGGAIKDAKIQLWQTDLDGNYLHPLAFSAPNPKSPEHSAIVSEFQYFGTDATDSDGAFEFLTYRPGIYTQRPFSHFHFMVWLDVGDDGGGGPDPSSSSSQPGMPALVTQFYFEDESPPFADALQLVVAEADLDVYGYGSYVNGTIVIDYDANPSSTGDAGDLLVLSPSQPQGPFYPTADFFSAGNDLTTATANDAGTQTAPVVPSKTSTRPPTLGPASPDSTMTLSNAGTPQTSQPAADFHALTEPPVAVLAPPVQSGSNDTLPEATTPTLQPVQTTLSSATSSGHYSDGSAAFWCMASYVVGQKFIG